MSADVPIKPIETDYKGYRFRSRLEARWAVFFDMLKLDYEYEPEGFLLPSGAKYLPDFFIRPMNLYVEIKPAEQMPYTDLRKTIEFAVDGDRKLLLIVGSPGKERVYILDRKHHESIEMMEAAYYGDSADFTDEEKVEGFFEATSEFDLVGFGVDPDYMGWKLIYRELPCNERHALQEAYAKARRARFEFGESGT